MDNNELIQAIGNIMEEKLIPIIEKQEKLQEDINGLKMTLENVTNRNIQILAEGHQLINERLDDAIRAESRIELTKIRVNVLEEEVKKLKAAINL